MKIIVTDYDPNWVSLFEVEAEKIRKILQGELKPCLPNASDWNGNQHF